jgi:hypothetical protein
MIVWIYRDPTKQVGDRDQFKVFAIGSRKAIWKAWPSSLQFGATAHNVDSVVLKTCALSTLYILARQ